MSPQGWLIAAAIVLILMAGWWASAEATLARLSAVGAEQLAGAARPTSKRLQAVFADLPRYLELLLLLRVTCETSATVLVVAAFVHWFGATWKAFLIALAVMVFVGYLVVGMSPVPRSRRGAERVALGAATVLYPIGVLLGPIPRLVVAGARAHPRQGERGRTARRPVRAARPGRFPGAAERHRAGRARDGPVGLRAGRHDRT